MIEYAPWSQTHLQLTLKKYRQKIFSILDIEVGGACNLSCIYCDSPDRSKKSKISKEDLDSFFASGKIEWLFLCGLGEPLANQNKSLFYEFIEKCVAHHVYCSMFTNAISIDDNVLEYVKSGYLYLLVKCDSLNSTTLNKIYGNNLGNTAIKQIHRLEKNVQIKEGCTNIGLSIVPTSLNKDEIPELLRFSLDRGFYPLIGDLEDSGMATPVFNSLKLKNRDLRDIREKIETILGEKYIVPICPSVIAGIHINHERQVIVDSTTGLSCHWFWLRAPQTSIVYTLDSVVSYDDIVSSILAYRNDKLITTKNLATELEPLVIGGCGGDIKYLLNEYVAIQELFKNR